MTYCTTTMLSDAKLTREVAQCCTPERFNIVADALMDASLRGDDRSSYPAADVSVADEVMVVVSHYLQEADSIINGYLSMRQPAPYPVPLRPVPGIVSVWARWIVRYLMHKDRVHTSEKTDPVVRDYERAVQFLKDTRDGKFSLGIGDPLPPPSSGAPSWSAPPRTFSQDTLKDFG